MNEPQTEPLIALEGAPNGSARIIHTVLVEKLEEAPWKAKTLSGIGKVVICVHFIDRDNDRTMIYKNEKGFGVRNDEPAPKIIVQLPQKQFYTLLKIPQGVAKLPALYRGGGWAVSKLLLKRTVVVKGLLRHPIASIRILQVLSVPPAQK